MHNTLKKLYRDHANINRLMEIAESQLDELKRTDQPVSDLLMDVVGYLSDYTDRIHHPVEDQLYQMMLARSDSGKQQMDQLLGDHLVLTDMTRNFRSALKAVGQDAASRAQADSLGREMVQQHREHMLLEEKEAFPLLRDELRDEDFDIAAGALPDDEDPLLDRNLPEMYPALAAFLSADRQ